MLYQQIAQNKRRTLYVMLGFTLLVILIGASIGYVFYGSASAGILMAVIFAIIYMVVMISQSTSIAMRMNNAHEITDASEYPDLWHIVEDMALVAKVPTPKLYIINDPSPNAFATGNKPENAAIAVTSGIMERLNREEMEGVIGHEMSHIRNYDIKLQTISLALSAAISMLVNVGMNAFWWGGSRRSDNDNEGGYGQIIMLIFSILLIILGPIAATIAQMALSRNREYLADASSVELTRNPQGLITALQKISASEPMEHPDPSSVAMYISDPMERKKSKAHLFDTHPPIEARIDRLEHM